MLHFNLKLFIGVLISLFIISCGSESYGLPEVKSNHPLEVKNILFAHGFMSSSETWEDFTRYSSNYANREWVPYLTSVSKTGTIIQRASELADYINAQNLDDNSVLAVGHSMGGLDLRYIISMGHQNQSVNNKYYTAAKKIYKLYTIATPHKGSNIASLVKRDNGAVHDLSVEYMNEFNQKYPYSNNHIDDRFIPMLAIRFTCQKAQKNDGVVAIDKQILENAPYSEKIYKGKHTSGLRRCEKNAREELTQSRIIEGILNDTIAAVNLKKERL